MSLNRRPLLLSSVSEHEGLNCEHHNYNLEKEAINYQKKKEPMPRGVPLFVHVLVQDFI